MKKIVSFAALLLSLVFASSCTKESSTEATGKKLAAPEIKIAALGPTSFSVKWSRVEGAANYEYEFVNAKATIDTTALTLDGLTENTEGRRPSLQRRRREGHREAGDAAALERCCILCL